MHYGRKFFTLPYTIKEVSELTGLPASTLRYYDKQGLLPNLRRDANNIRIFSDDDCSSLRLIECLKQSGLSIRDIKNFIDMAGKGKQTLNERLKIFYRRREILRDDLKNLTDILSVIEYKCWYYEQACEAGSEEIMKDIMPKDIPENLRRGREILLNSKFTQCL